MRCNWWRSGLFGILAIGVALTAGALSAQAQNFNANPNNLFFSAQVGTFANSQPISLTSSGAQMSFTTTVSVTSPTNGSWLNVSSASSTTPATLNVSVGVFGLAPNNNNYTGTITIQQVGGPAALTIPIDLNVFGDRELQVDPGILTFVSNNGGAPERQQLQITAIGTHSGALSFRTSVLTDDGGNWLTITPPQTTTPRLLNISAQVVGLTPTDHSAIITIADTANRTTSVGVSLLFRSSNAPAISLSKAILDFATAQGTSPPSQNVGITNSATGVMNWSAAASTQSGGNWLAVSPPSGTAPSTMTVSVNSASLAKGTYTGTAMVSATGASNTPQTVNVNLAVGLPIVNTNGVINGASFSPDAVVAPLSIVSLFGQQLATDFSNFTTVPLPTILGGTQVFVNDIAAPLFAVSPGQINFQVSAGLSGSTATVAVSLNGSRGPNSTMNLAPAVPGIFTLSQNGVGPGAVLNQDFTVNSASNTEARGRVLQIYATGLGATNPPIAAGQQAATAEPLNRTVATPIVTIGGIPALVQFSAMAPGYVGLYQVNAVIPAGVSTGSAVPLQIQIGGVSSNIATVAIR